MCREKLYPPRFTICIQEGRASSEVVAEIRFPGAMVFQGQGEPVSKICLAPDYGSSTSSGLFRYTLNLCESHQIFSIYK